MQNLRIVVAALVLAIASPLPARAAPPAPPPAPVESDADAAARLRQQGNEAMLAMRYSDALAFYKQALALAPGQVGLHYSAARAHQFLGEYAEALAALERFDKEASPEAKAKVGQLDGLFAQIRPRVSTLSLACNVEGARVLVGDKVIGTTPLSAVRLPAGATTLQVELEGFFSEVREITLPGQGALALNVELHKKSTSALLSIRTDPLGSTVFVDGQPVGTTNPKIEITTSAGSHELLARHDGYDTAKVPIVLQSGATRDLSIPLQKSVPITARWWFWTGATAVVAGGVVAAIALSTERGASHGSLTPGQISGP